VLATKFRAYQIVDTDQQKSAGKQVPESTLRFLLDGSDADIIIPLEPNDIRDANYRAVATTIAGEVLKDRTAVKWFKGYVNGDRSAPARFSREADGLSGFFFQGTTLRFVEPLQRHDAASPGPLIVYDATDVISPQVKCDANELEQYRAATAARQATAVLPLSNSQSLKIATEADSTYYGYYGKDTNDHILGVINQVEGLYENDFGINFRVTYQHVFETDDGDPYTSATALTLLEQFRDYWNAHHQDVDRHIAFLFNAVTASALGRAYQAQACTDVNSSYGFFSYRDFLYEAPVVAHEIGHTLNASHETPENCRADPSLMCASVSQNVPFKFSAIAQADISAYLNSHPCFNDPIETRIHPNPARAEDLIIECSTSLFSATLYDALGKKSGVWTFSSAIGTIPTTELPQGLYILQIIHGNQVRTHRIEILHP
jgi:hypothetical protein